MRPRMVESPGQELLRWRSIPSRRSARITGFVTVMVFGVPALLWLWAGPFFGGLGLVILGGSLLPFFVPTEYRFTEETAEKRYLGIEHRRRWTEFRSFSPDRHGVLLSPFPVPSRLENFRGLYVRFENNREAVLAVVEEKVNPANAASHARR